MSRKFIFVAITWFLLCPGFSSAQEEVLPSSAASEEVIKRLREINSTLDEIHVLLSVFISQKQNVLITAELDTVDRNIAFLSNEWRAITVQLHRLEVQATESDRALAAMDREMEEMDGSVGELTEEARDMLDARETELNETSDLMRDLRKRKRELEETLARRRAQRDALEQ